MKGLVPVIEAVILVAIAISGAAIGYVYMRQVSTIGTINIDSFWCVNYNVYFVLRNDLQEDIKVSDIKVIKFVDNQPSVMYSVEGPEIIKAGEKAKLKIKNEICTGFCKYKVIYKGLTSSFSVLCEAEKGKYKFAGTWDQYHNENPGFATNNPVRLKITIRGRVNEYCK